MDEVARRGRIRSKDWSRVSHGLYVVDPGDIAATLTAWRLVLPPGAAFTHLSAARARGWWLPPVPAGLPVLAAAPHGGPRPRRTGLQVTRLPGAFGVEHQDGLPLTSPTETLIACARDLGVLDLVVLADAALHARDTTLDELTEAAAARRRGAPRLRAALPWCDGRAESPWETLLRVLHVSAGVPVVPQHELRDGRAFIARGDLWVEGTTTLHEYDGAHHRSSRQQRDDLARDRRIANVGWTRRGYTAVEVLHQAASIVRDADLALGREHEPGRLRRWHALLAESTFTHAGRARLLGRVAGGG